MTALPINQVVCGNCLEVMRDFPSESVNFVMFSPPYWGLRDYGVEGQFGLEPTYQMYVAHLVEVGREIRRILRKDGSWYLNLGDTYAGSWQNYGARPELNEDAGGQRPKNTEYFEREGSVRTFPPTANVKGISPKCKLLIPYRVALALIGDGWICRNDITWHKGNPMPSSVKDRLNTTTERVFHFVKSKKYYYDLDAIREPHKDPTEKIEWHKTYKRSAETKIGGHQSGRQKELEHKNGVVIQYHPLGKNPGDVIKWDDVPGQTPQSIRKHSGYFGPDGKCLVDFEKGKNPGDFWTINTRPSPEAHFAVYPAELCVKPIKSSCPPNGIVLDPMCGAGTTLVVAKRLGMRSIGIDINPDYCEMARKRLTDIEFRLEAFA